MGKSRSKRAGGKTSGDKSSGSEASPVRARSRSRVGTHARDEREGERERENIRVRESVSVQVTDLAGTLQQRGPEVSRTEGSKKRKVAAVYENEDCANESMSDEMFAVRMSEKIKKVGDEIRGFILNEANKVSKSACEYILKRVSKYELLIGQVLCDSARVSGRLDECEKERERLRKSVEHGPVPRSFASVAAGGAARGAPGVPDAPSMNASMSANASATKRMNVRPSFAVVVKGGANETSADIMGKIVKDVSGSVNVCVRSIRSAKSGGVVIETASENDRERLKKSERFVQVGLRVEEPKRLDPRVIVYDVPNEMTEATFLEGMYVKNASAWMSEREFRERVKVVTRNSKAGATLGNIVVEVSPALRDKLLAEGRVYVGWSAHRVNVYERVNRCFGCLGYGHMLRECKKERMCHKCGRPGHKAVDCTAPDSCVNCRERGLPSGHMSTSTQCPEYVWRLERMRSRISAT